jgi:hypothetical protein
MADQKVTLVYTDDDGKRHEYDGDPSQLTFKQLWDMQKMTGLNGLAPIGDAMSEMNAAALMAFLWVHIREEEPDTQFSDMNSVRVGQIELIGNEEDPKEPTSGDGPSSTSDDATSSTGSYPSSDTTSEFDPPTSPI